MPAKKRFSTKYPGVYYIESTSVADGKPEQVFYIRYRKDGQMIEEKAGRQYQDDMTAAKANRLRGKRIEGDQPTNEERREAERKAKEAEEGRWTVKKLWEEYQRQRPNLKGAVTDKNRFENYIGPAFGEKEPSEIIPLDIKRLENRILKKRKPATARNAMELLRRIINFGVNHRLCSGIDFQIQMPEVNNLKTEDLTPEQLAKLLEVIEKALTPKPPKKVSKAKGKKEEKEETYSPDAAAMMKLVLFTGLRRGELFRLKWEHIDEQRGFITLVDPKGGQDQKIPLNEAARKLLESLPKGKSPYVFPGRKGRQRTDIKNAANRIKNAAGLPEDFRPLHGLRHLYASMLASSGKVDMFTLQKLLTHKSPQMTQRYAHLRDESLKQAAELAGDLISDVGKDDGKVIPIRSEK
ncbi:MAG: tyrosine-type recombinase/integrase [Desulfobacterales bacterium]